MSYRSSPTLEDQPEWIIEKNCLSEQVKRFRARFAQSVEGRLGEVISARGLERLVGEQAGEFRERLYGPVRTLELFIEQALSADHSCQDAVARGASTRVSLGEARGSLNTGPYCKARRRLALGLVQHLSQEVGRRLERASPRGWFWRGRSVKLVDGATVCAPDTPENQACYPQNREQAPGLGFPLVRLVGIVSLSHGAVLDYDIGPCEGAGTGETALLWAMADKLKSGDVVIADSYYAGYFLLARLMGMGVDVVVRQHSARHTDFRRGQRLGPRDHLVDWRRPPRPAWMDESTYAQMPATLRLREVRAGGWTVVSSLTNATKVSKQELLELYRSRWQIELDLRAIKTVMQMDMLRCKSPEMIKKEIAVYLLAYNLVRAIMARAALGVGLVPRQLSFKGAMQTLNAFHDVLRHAPAARCSIMRAHVLGAIGTQKLPDRPPRSEPRAVKRRNKTHPRLSQPRRVLRAKLRPPPQRSKIAGLR